MIRYKVNILKKLNEKGYSSYKIRKEKLFSEATMTKFRNNDTSVTLSNIETICKLLDCQPGDILEYVPDEPDENK